jgi:hypothetical protein
MHPRKDQVRSMRSKERYISIIVERQMAIPTSSWLNDPGRDSLVQALELVLVQAQVSLWV